MDFVADGVKDFLVGRSFGIAVDGGNGGKDSVYKLGDVFHVLLDEAARGDSRRAYANAGGLERGTAVEGNHVLIDGDVGFAKLVFGHLARHVGELRAEVDQHEVIVRAAGNDLVALGHECGAHRLGVADYLLLVGDIFRLHGLEEGDSLGCYHMLQRTALLAGEYGRVDNLRHFLDDALRGRDAPRIVEVLSDEDYAATGTAEGLVGRGGHNVGVLHGVVEQTGGDEAGGVGHVNPEDGPDAVGDLPHAGIVPLAGVGRGASDDELRALCEGDFLHLVVVDEAGVFPDAVGDGFIEDAGRVDGRAVGEVTTMGEVEAHEGVARAENGHLDCEIGLGAAVGLDIGVFGIVDLLQAVDGRLLDLVYDFAAAVVAVAGVALGVFIGADGAHGFKHLVTDIVFGSDELETGRLALIFLLDKIEDL